MYVFLFYLHRKNYLRNSYFLCEGYFSNWSSANRNFTRPDKIILRMAHNDRSETIVKTYSQEKRKKI